MEWRLFPEGEIPHVSTAEFHADRERAPHLEQPIHKARLEKAAEFAVDAVSRVHLASVSDLGCGDGGLLSLLMHQHGIESLWGYDFQPSNAAGWVERGVTAYPLDAFGADRSQVQLGNVSVCTEVLEHLSNPHGAVRWIAHHSQYLVASSPYTENDISHDACHAWAWDQEGYAALLNNHGWEVVRHETVGMFQVIMGRSRYVQ